MAVIRPNYENLCKMRNIPLAEIERLFLDLSITASTSNSAHHLSLERKSDECDHSWDHSHSTRTSSQILTSPRSAELSEASWESRESQLQPGAARLKPRSSGFKNHWRRTSLDACGRSVRPTCNRQTSYEACELDSCSYLRRLQTIH